MPEDAAVERCLTLVAQLNAEQKWDLPPHIQQHYAQQVAACYKDATTIDAARLCATSSTITPSMRWSKRSGMRTIRIMLRAGPNGPATRCTFSRPGPAG